jgi:small subunit ribosomal protein S17
MSADKSEHKRSPKKPPERGMRKTAIGLVESDKMDKTIVVVVDRQVKHAKYKKYLTRTSKYYAHDETNEAHKGDRVLIGEARPISKLKRWRLLKVVERAPSLGEELEAAVTRLIGSEEVAEKKQAEASQSGADAAAVPEKK